MGKIDVKSKNVDELKEFLTTELQEKGFRATQIFKWLHDKNVITFADMRNLSHNLQTKLEQSSHITTLDTVTRHQAKDGTIKYLFQLEDGQTIESVYLPYADGRQSICISSQVGCGMGCSFCATAIGGFIRNLTPAEIVEQVYAVQRDLSVRITNVVLMGMGEPLLNYDSVIKAIRLLNDPLGTNIGIRKITLSTCGIVPQIRQLSKEDLQLVLAISLHAPNDALRNQLMPINRKYPLVELISACSEYTKITRRRITFEYAVIAGVNDLPEHAEQLVRLIKGLLCHVNLIPINPVEGFEFGRPSRVNLQGFMEIISNNGIEVSIREERGTDIDAACGQLRRRNEEVKS